VSANNDRFIILISGKQRAGKNEVAERVNKYLNNTFVVVPIAERIKEEYSHRTGYSIEEIDYMKNLYPHVRKALIDLGNEFKKGDLYHWVDLTLEQQGNLIIPDMRYKYELERVEAFNTNTLTIRVEANKDVRARRGTLSNEEDPSETSLDDYDWWDYFIENDKNKVSLDIQCEIIADSVETLMRQAKATV